MVQQVTWYSAKLFNMDPMGQPVSLAPLQSNLLSWVHAKPRVSLNMGLQRHRP